MNYKILTNETLIDVALLVSKNIRQQTIALLEILKEIDKRKLYCEFSYPSLFQYVVMELKFSESQAAIYCNLTRHLGDSPGIKKMLTTGELNLGSAHQVTLVIKDHPEIYKTEDKILAIARQFSQLSKKESKIQGDLLRGKKVEVPTLTIKLSHKLTEKIEKLKRKYNLPKAMNPENILEFLIDEKLTDTFEINEDNKVITKKTKSILLVKANHQCEFRTSEGKRCQETRFLEVDHITPRAFGGNNKTANLRIFCTQHNKKAAMNLMGAHTISKWTPTLPERV